MKNLSKKKKLFACALAAIVGFATGTAVRAGTLTYTAFCNTTHGLNGSWQGSDRSSREDAAADAEAHRKSWAGHSPEVLEH